MVFIQKEPVVRVSLPIERGSAKKATLGTIIGSDISAFRRQLLEGSSDSKREEWASHRNAQLASRLEVLLWNLKKERDSVEGERQASLLQILNMQGAQSAYQRKSESAFSDLAQATSQMESLVWDLNRIISIDTPAFRADAARLKAVFESFKANATLSRLAVESEIAILAEKLNEAGRNPGNRAIDANALRELGATGISSKTASLVRKSSKILKNFFDKNIHEKMLEILDKTGEQSGWLRAIADADPGSKTTIVVLVPTSLLGALALDKKQVKGIASGVDSDIAYMSEEIRETQELLRFAKRNLGLLKSFGGTIGIQADKLESAQRSIEDEISLLSKALNATIELRNLYSGWIANEKGYLLGIGKLMDATSRYADATSRGLELQIDPFDANKLKVLQEKQLGIGQKISELGERIKQIEFLISEEAASLLERRENRARHAAASPKTDQRGKARGGEGQAHGDVEKAWSFSFNLKLSPVAPPAEAKPEAVQPEMPLAAANGSKPGPKKTHDPLLAELDMAISGKKAEERLPILLSRLAKGSNINGLADEIREASRISNGWEERLGRSLMQCASGEQAKKMADLIIERKELQLLEKLALSLSGNDEVCIQLCKAKDTGRLLLLLVGESLNKMDGKTERPLFAGKEMHDMELRKIEGIINILAGQERFEDIFNIAKRIAAYKPRKGAGREFCEEAFNYATTILEYGEQAGFLAMLPKEYS